MATAKTTVKLPDEIQVGKKKYIKGMKKPAKLPAYNFPDGFFATETTEAEVTK